MVLTVKAPPPSLCRPPPDPPPSKFLSVAFETLDSIIPPETPDPPDSFFVLVLLLQCLASFFSDSHGVSLRILTQAWDFKSPLSDLAINSISGVSSPGPSYLSNKPCEGDMVLKMVLSDAETMISLASFSAILDTDLLAMMAFETLMSLFCEIVWICQDANEVSRALVVSALMVEALNLCSALHKAKEISLLSCHIFSDSQVFISTLRLGCVLNEIAGVLHDGRSLATLFNPLSFSFIPCNVQAVSLAKASLDCMNVENFVF